MKLRAIICFAFFVCCCRQKQPVVDTETAAPKAAVRLCASVSAVTGEYVPLFHTNVFVRTEDEKLAEAIEKELSRLHKYFDCYHYYHDDSDSVVKNTKILNDHISSGKRLRIDAPLVNIINDSIRMMKLTDSNFNVFLAPLSRLYAAKFSSFPIENTDPKLDAIDEALKHILSAEDAERVIAVAGNEISFSPHGDTFDYSFDFGGIAKGYAAQTILKLYPAGTYMLSLGSSTIVSCGKSYRIGVVSPYYKMLALMQIDLPDGMSLSTSGTMNNYYICSGDSHTIRSHIIDPHTGCSNDWWWSVIIISDNALVSDSLGTALFNVQDEAKIIKIIEGVKNAYGCTVEACFVKDESREDKTVSLVMTEGFVPYIRSEYEEIGIAAKRQFSVVSKESL